MTPRAGITSDNRMLLEKLHQSVSGPFSIAEAATVLGMPALRARRFLAHLGAQGWLTRVRRGLYLVVPLGAEAPRDWREDPWIVASTLFTPCYVGGWSACEHWDLTEQIFREIVVVTSKGVRRASQTVQSTTFKLKHVAPGNLFGTRSVWRGNVKVQVSDPSRTIADILAEPALGGGIRQVATSVAAYFVSEHRADDLLLSYIERIGNKSGYKRLGFLLERLPVEAPDLLKQCLARQSQGITRLDPLGPKAGQIVSRWNLQVNVVIRAENPV